MVSGLNKSFGATYMYALFHSGTYDRVKTELVAFCVTHLSFFKISGITTVSGSLLSIK